MSNRLTLRHLRYFTVVATELNFRRAAEKLGVSQPPLSRQVRELEDIVGVALLERDTQRVALTAAGETLLRDARKLLQDADQLVDGIRATHSRTVPAFATSLTVTAAQGETFKRLLSRTLGAGNFTLATGQRSPQIADDLRAGRLAGALVSQPANLGACRSVPVFTDPLLAALPAGHPAARKRVVPLGAITGLPLFWWPRSFNTAYFDLLMQVLARNRLRPRLINVELAQLLTLERIAHGEGFTLMNQSRERTRLPGLTYRPLSGADELAIEVVFAWNDQLDEAVARKIGSAARKQLA